MLRHYFIAEHLSYLPTGKLSFEVNARIIIQIRKDLFLTPFGRMITRLPPRIIIRYAHIIIKSAGANLI